VIRGRLIGSAVLGLAMFVATPASSPAELLDATCAGPTNGGQTASWAQTFTAVHTGTLVRGEMFIAKTAGADFKMQILAADPSGPVGGALGTATIPDSSIPNITPTPTGPSAPIDGTFNPGIPVVAGQQYAITVIRNAGSFMTKDRSGNPCAGGEFSGTVGGTWMSINPNDDSPFSTFVEPSNDFAIVAKRPRHVTVHVPNPGLIVFHQAPFGLGKTAEHGQRVFKGSQVTAAGAGDFDLPVHLTRTGRRLLRENGMVKRRIDLNYTPTGGLPRSVRAKLKIKKR
jgi:hypothetical protein